MRAFTLNQGGELVEGIEVHDGWIHVGTRPFDRKPVTFPLHPLSIVRDGRLFEAPGRGATILLRDQAGSFGSWHLRAAQPVARWDAMVAVDTIPNALDRILQAERVRARYPHRPPVGWYEFARGLHGPPVAENARPRLNVYGYIEEGAAFEIRRRGRLDGAPSVFLVECRGGAVLVSDPRAAAMARAAAQEASP